MDIQRIEIDTNNYDSRRERKKGNVFIVVHGNGATAQSTKYWFQDPSSRVSYHYLITLGGDVWQFVEEEEIAFHAGESHWDDHSGLNSWSIGVCIESDEGAGSQITDAQHDTLLKLTRDIQMRHNIKTDYVRGHKEVSPGRKFDAIHLDMDKFRQDLDAMSSGEPVEDAVKTLVLHDFDGLGLEGGQIVVRGRMLLNRRGDKLDIRLLD